MDNKRRDPRTHLIIGAAMEVHKELGHGFLEPVYQEALELEMVLRKIPFQREITYPVHYKEKPLSAYYRADFLCFESIILELKALSRISSVEESQLLNYLKVTKKEIGVLLNFGTNSLQFRRMILSQQ